jgi:hypothetical protein
MNSGVNITRTAMATTARLAAYATSLERILPAVRAAVKTGCSTGVHIRDFLNAVDVPAPTGRAWTVSSCNRAVRALILRGMLKTHRHRGRRNPSMELHRRNFAKAVETYRAAHLDALQNQPAASK